MHVTGVPAANGTKGEVGNVGVAVAVKKRGTIIFESGAVDEDRLMEAALELGAEELQNAIRWTSRARTRSRRRLVPAWEFADADGASVVVDALTGRVLL